jgi:hypothetical protein
MRAVTAFTPRLVSDPMSNCNTLPMHPFGQYGRNRLAVAKHPLSPCDTGGEQALARDGVILDRIKARFAAMPPAQRAAVAQLAWSLYLRRKQARMWRAAGTFVESWLQATIRHLRPLIAVISVPSFGGTPLVKLDRGLPGRRARC